MDRRRNAARAVLGRWVPRLALAALVGGCSSGSSPTAPALPAPGPTPPPASGPGGQPPVLAQASHKPGWSRADCLVCHQPNLLAGHADLSASQCLGCHGDNGTAPGYQRCLVCHGDPPSSGAHTTHLALGGLGVSCSTCHNDAGIYRAARHRDGVVQVAIDPARGGAYDGRACGGTSCHGGGTSPSWRDGTITACTACHDPQGGSPIGPKSGAHASHIGRGLACETCHPATPASHWNGRLDNPTGVVPDGGSYADQTPDGYNPSGASGTCSGLGGGCHGLPAPWTAADSCTLCHATPPASGSHASHVAPGSGTRACATCHEAYPAGHANGRPDVVFGNGLNGSWSGRSCSAVYCHGGGSRPLAPAGGSNTTPRWGDPTAGTCGACHGAPGGANGWPPTGKHEEHVDAFGFDCADCHARWPGEHVDGLRTVVFGPAAGDARFTRAAQPNRGSCAAVECHADWPADDRTWN